MNHFVLHEQSAQKGFDPSMRSKLTQGRTLREELGDESNGFDSAPSGSRSGLALSLSTPTGNLVAVWSLKALRERSDSKGKVRSTASNPSTGSGFDPERLRGVEGSKPARIDLPFWQAHYSRTERFVNNAG
jgi:hypothetical protein